MTSKTGLFYGRSFRRVEADDRLDFGPLHQNDVVAVSESERTLSVKPLSGLI